MSESTGFLFRLRAFLLRRRMERELDEEIQFHLEQEAQKHRASGLDADQALHQARLSFGRISHHKDDARQAWGVRLLDDFVSDGRYALRQLAAHAGFGLVAILTLALGIGGTVALSGVIHSLFLRPLPYQNADQLRVFWDEYSWSAAEYDFARNNTTAYQGLASFTVDAQTFRLNDRTTMVTTGLLSGDAFDVLATRPFLGRVLEHREERLGTEPVVVLGYDFWSRQFNGDRALLGQQIELDGNPVTVVGVMPRDFYFPTPEIEIWRPLTIDPAERDFGANHWLVVFGRVQEGLTDDQVEADLGRFALLLGDNFEYPEAWDKTKGFFVEPMREYLLGKTRPALLLLLSAVALLLIMATTNVAGLLVARMSDRDTELKVRKAIGAGRLRLSRQWITENVLLVSMASALGWLLAVAGYRSLIDRLPLPVGFNQTLAPTSALAAATLALIPLIVLIISTAPLRRLWRNSSSALGSRRGVGPARGQLQQGLVVAEIAIAVVLLTCATLFARSVIELYNVDLGLNPKGVATLDLFVPSSEFDSDQRRAFFDRLIEATESSAGFEYATVTNRLPLRDEGGQGPILAEGRPDLEGPARPNSKWRFVTANYFRTLGIELLDGRPFDSRDRADSAQVGIIGTELAERLWPGQDPIGKRVQMGFQYEDWIEIVGVTVGVRHDRVQEPASAVLYRPLAQIRPSSAAVFAARSSLGPRATLSTMRALAQELDSRVAIASPTTMDEILRTGLTEPLRLRFFLALFSMLALLIGAVGIYGVVSYSVSRRTEEFGLRMALGAERADLLRSVMAFGLKPVLIGVAGGLAATFLTSQLISRFVYGVEARDPWSYLVAALLLVAIGVLAAVAPAYRASRIDPATTLQSQ